MGSSKAACRPAQIEGLSKLHQLTYKLTPIKTIAEIDETCRLVATDLILAANPAPSAVKNLPPMRPQPLPESSPQSGPKPRTLTQLRREPTPCRFPPRLKRQLIGLSGVADAAAADPKAQEQASSLYDTLSAVIDLSDGIEKNTGIDPAARPKIEQQLTEGLALFTDPRTRSAGAQRIARTHSISPNPGAHWAPQYSAGASAKTFPGLRMGE